MAAKVSYEQLQRIAMITGQDIKKVAEARGINEEELAKLQELGGEVDAPMDLVDFTAKVDGKDVRFNVPLDLDMDIPMQDPEVKAFMAEKGFYALKTEGNKLKGVYATGETEDIADVKKEADEAKEKAFLAQVNAKREEAEKLLAENEAWKSSAIRLAGVSGAMIAVTAVAAVVTSALAAAGVEAAVAETTATEIVMNNAGKMAINGLLNKAAVTTLIAMGLASCGEKLDDAFKAPEPDRISQIVITSSQYAALLKEIIAMIDQGNRNDDRNYNLLMDMAKNLQLLVNNGVTKDDANDLIKKLIAAINAAKDDINTELSLTGTNIQNAIAILMEAVKEGNADISKILREINEQVKAIREEINDKLTKSLELEAGISSKLSVMIEQNEEAFALSTKIYEAIKNIESKVGNLDANLQAQFKALVSTIVNVGGDISGKYKDLEGILNIMNQNIKNGTEAQVQAIETSTAAILKKLNELGLNITKGVDKIYQAVVNNKVDLSKVEKTLDDIKALMDKFKNRPDYTEIITRFGNAILEAIGSLNFNTNVDLSGIEALLNRLVEGQELTNWQLQTLTDKFDKFTSTQVAQLNTIIAKLDKSSPDYTAQLDAIIELIQKLDTNNETRTNKVIAAIDKLGVNIIAELKKKNPVDYSKQLETIINLLGHINPGASFDVDLSKIEKSLESLVAIATDNNDLLKKLKESNDVIRATLASFVKDAGEHFKNSEAWLKKIYEKIPAGSSGGCNVDFDKLMAKLDEILNAIKNHEVEVTVDVSGTVKCECSHCQGDGGSTHEGIIGNLNTLLG